MTLHTGRVDLQAAHDIVRHAVATGEIPGAVALVRWRGETVLHEAEGWCALEPERLPMQPDTVFDLASLTKPLVTAPLILLLAERGELALDDPVDRHFPLFRHFAGGTTTIRRLLLHTSGLPAWSALYVLARDREDVLPAIASMEPAYAPGTQVVYSCLGYIVLGSLVERLMGSSLDQVASRVMFAPLGLKDTGYGAGVDAGRCAWTERGNPYERRNVEASGLHFDGWRTTFSPGQVHDGNAWYAMKGVSGNAGLFGTAQDVGVIGQMWLDGGRAGTTQLLETSTVEAACADGTPELDEGRGLGWQMARPFPAGQAIEPRSAGTRLGPRTFGHTGFTGTSIWIDPDLELVVVLLTNRVHPSVDDGTAIIRLRSKFHDAVADSVRRAAAWPSAG